jgi:hypothetical protein
MGIELYESKLDSVDEVIYFSNFLGAIQTQNPQFFGSVWALLDMQEQNLL